MPVLEMVPMTKLFVALLTCEVIRTSSLASNASLKVGLIGVVVGGVV